MSYKVLARKWRPKNFSMMAGQQHVLLALTNALSSGRIHHAYLFSGMHGVGKTTVARILAKGLNCQTGITANPCNLCENCKEINEGNFIDLIEIDAASRTKIEDMRELLDTVNYYPARGSFKIYLIDEVHMLSRYSFNYLLKIIEEPPEHVQFILATTDPIKLPLTILSRCLQLHFKALTVNQIKNKLLLILEQEKINIDIKAIELIAYHAHGSMRNALSLIDQAISMGNGKINLEITNLMFGAIITEQPFLLVEALINANIKEIFNIIYQCELNNINFEKLLVEIMSLLHRMSMVKFIHEYNEDIDHNLTLKLANLSKKISINDLQSYYQIIIGGRKELSYTPSYRMGVEMILLRALAFNKNKKGRIC